MILNSGVRSASFEIIRQTQSSSTAPAPFENRPHTFDIPKEKRMSHDIDPGESIFHPGGRCLFIGILLTICHGCEIKPGVFDRLGC